MKRTGLRRCWCGRFAPSRRARLEPHAHATGASRCLLIGQDETRGVAAFEHTLQPHPRREGQRANHRRGHITEIERHQAESAGLHDEIGRFDGAIHRTVDQTGAGSPRPWTRRLPLGRQCAARQRHVMPAHPQQLIQSVRLPLRLTRDPSDPRHRRAPPLPHAGSQRPAATGADWCVRRIVLR